jgi:hypothetical protein
MSTLAAQHSNAGLGATVYRLLQKRHENGLRPTASRAIKLKRSIRLCGTIAID